MASAADRQVANPPVSAADRTAARKAAIGGAVRDLSKKGTAKILPPFRRKNIGPKSGKKFDVKGHPFPDTGKGTVKTEQARLVKKVKPKQLGKDKGQFRKVKSGFKRRRFTFDQRQDFRTMRNIPEHGPTGPRPKPKGRKPKGPHGPTDGRPVVDPGTLT